MRRHFYIAENLDDIRNLEKTLAEQGIAENQYHVLSEDDVAVKKNHLHEVASIFKRDIVHLAEMGALVGVLCALLLLGLTYSFGWAQSPYGWAPFVALAVLALCFCTWEGAFLGIQLPNARFKRFRKILKQGKHIFFIDLDDNQEKIRRPIRLFHPTLVEAGTGEATPGWILKSHDSFKRVIKALP